MAATLWRSKTRLMYDTGVYCTDLSLAQAADPIKNGVPIIDADDAVLKNIEATVTARNPTAADIAKAIKAP